MKNKPLIAIQFFAVCFLAASSPAHASAEASAPNTEKAVNDARAIVAAAKTADVMDAMFVQLVPVMESAFVGRLTTSAVGAELLKNVDAKYPGGREGFGKRFGEIVLSGIRAKYPELLEKMVQQYVRELSPEDLAAIRAFYETPSGNRLLATQPKLQGQFSEIGRAAGELVGADSAETLLNEAEKYLGEIK